MVRIILVFIFSVFIGVLASFGGNDNIPGYIVTLQNDTIEGSLRFENSISNPIELIFMPPGASDEIIYSPHTIKEFGIGTEKYKSAIVKVEQSSNQTSNLSKSAQLSYISDTVFLQVVISGERELLLFVDEYGKNSFYINNGGTFDWLVHKRYQITENEKSRIAYNNNYIGQLIIYFVGCPSINQVISNTSYNLSSLKKAFKYYYDCSNSDAEVVKEDPLIDLKLAALAGLTITKVSFSGVGVDYLTAVQYPWVPMVTAGVSADLFFPKTFGNRWSLNNELLVVSYGVKATYDELINSNSRRSTQTHIGSTYVKLANMFRANFSINYSSIFLDIGVINGFAFASENTMKETTYVGMKEYYEEGKAISSLKKYELSMLFGIGIHGKKLSGMIRYEIGGGVSGDPDIDSSMSRFYFQLGYRFLN